MPVVYRGLEASKEEGIQRSTSNRLPKNLYLHIEVQQTFYVNNAVQH